MNEDRDLNRLLDAWFAEGPVQVADRVVDGTADRIARQRQLPAWRLRSWRFPTMSTPLKLVAIGAALLAVLAGGAVFIGGGRGQSSRDAHARRPRRRRRPARCRFPMAALEPRDLRSRIRVPGNPLTWTITVPGGWTGFQDYAVSYDVAPDDTGVSVGGPTENEASPRTRAPRRGPKPAASVDDLIAAGPGARRLDRLGTGRRDRQRLPREADRPRAASRRDLCGGNREQLHRARRGRGWDLARAGPVQPVRPVGPRHRRQAPSSSCATASRPRGRSGWPSPTPSLELERHHALTGGPPRRRGDLARGSRAGPARARSPRTAP